MKVVTHGRKVLDVVLTNLWRFFNDPVTVMPVPVDNVTKGVPSDHLGIVVTPILSASPARRQKRTIVFRPMPESLLNSFGNEICNTTWDILAPEFSSTEITEAFQSKMTTMIDHHLLVQSFTITDLDQPWITKDLKNLKRLRSREYCRHGKSPKYLELKAKFSLKQDQAVEHYTQRIINEVKEGTRSSSYKALRTLGVRNGDTKDDLFSLPQHIAENLSEQQSAERIADFFSNISQEFEPLALWKLPPNVQSCISMARNDPSIPVLEPYEVHRRISKAKKPNSVIHGDVPKRIVQLFSPELALPVSKIYNKITSSSEYPRQWVKESQILIQKVFPPNSEDDLRPISRTFFFSKVYESFVSEWLLPFIQPFMDPGQYGMKGSSIVHYLIKFLHFVHSSLDLKQPNAVLAALY